MMLYSAPTTSDGREIIEGGLMGPELFMDHVINEDIRYGREIKSFGSFIGFNSCRFHAIH